MSLSNEFATKNTDYTIVVIDDDANLLQLTNEILKQNEYKTHAFTNAKDAIEFVKSNPFDLILTDIQMPNMDGFEFVRTNSANHFATHNCYYWQNRY